MEIEVTPKKWYVVSGATGSTVSKPDGTVIATVPEGGQTAFLATTYTVVTSNAKIEVVESTFNFALAMLGLHGGGSSGDEPTEVPSGYIPALFLESQANCSIATDYLPTNNTKIAADLVTLNDTYYGRLCGNTGSGTGSGMFAVHLRGLIGGLNCLAFDFGSSRTNVLDFMNLNERHTVSFSQAGVFRDGVLIQEIPTRAPFVATEPLYVFSVPQSAIGASGCHQIYTFNVFDGVERVFSFIPCLTANGAPCFFDMVSRQSFENIGSTPFIIGMTVSQARKLWMLPADATTKTLTISLPQSAFVDVETGEIADADVNAALAYAETKGWVITKQYYTE